MLRRDYRSLGDVVRERGGAEREKTALIFEDRSLSYAELDRRSNQVANLLIAQGIGIGDRVAILSKNNVCYLDILFGTAKAGGVLVPLNWRLAPTEIGYIIGDSDPALLFVERGLEALVPAEASDGRQLIAFSDRGTCDYDADLETISDADQMVDVGADDIAMLIYTSGTTGHPKGAMILHRNFVRHCETDAPEVPYWTGVSREEICLVVLPLFHVGGLELVLRPLFSGATVILHREVDLGMILTDIERYRVTMTGLVPTALQMMLSHPQATSTDFSSLNKFLYGAAPITIGLLKEGLERMGCDFVQSYGMTEANGVFVMLSPADHADRDAPRLRSAGKPTFDAEVRIVDLETRKDVNTGEVGEIMMRGSSVMKGDWNRPEATAEAIDGDGWLASGDAGYRDADGFIYVCDRVKDMIVSGGENIYPAEVESAIYGHPAVAEVAVIGVPDPRWGETVKAVVVPRAGETIDPDAIVAWARGRIAHYKAPRSVATIDALPKNAAGKILRRQVRALFTDSETLV